MKPIFPKRIALIVILSLLAVCEISADNENDQIPQPQIPEGYKNKTIRLVGGSNYFPYEFLNEKGEPDGFNVELIKVVMDKLGLQYEIHLGLWPDVMAQMERGDADVMLGVINSKEREMSMSLTVPHSKIYLSYITRAEDRLNSIYSLSGKTIAVDRNGISHHYISAAGITRNLALYDDTSIAVQDLEKGKVDAVLCPSVISHLLLKANKNKGLKVHHIDEPYYSLSFGVNKGDSELLTLVNMGLMQVILNNEYSDIYKKWMGSYERHHVSRPMAIIFLSLVSLVLVAGVFVILLRYRINKVIKRLCHSENNFREIFNATTEGIVLESMRGEILDCNQGALDMFGYSKEEFLKIDPDLILAPNRLLREEQLAYLSNHDFYTYERMARKKSGLVFWVEVSLKKIILDGQETTLSVVRDISLRKKSQKELMEAREELIIAMRIGKLTAWVYDVNNDYFYNLHGNLITGKMTIEDIFARMIPEEVPRYRSLYQEMCSGKRSSSEYILRIYSSTAPNTILSYETRAFAIKNDDGEVIRLIGTQRDVTEELKMRKELVDFRVRTDFIMKSTGMLMWLYDTRDRTFISSDSLFVRPNIHVGVDEYLTYIFHEDLNNYMDFLDKMDVHTEDKLNLEYRFHVPNVKTPTWEVVEAMPLDRDENSVPIVYIGLVRNNNKWRAMADNLIKLRLKAEEANVMKSSFLANMSHEIRTPLNAILGFSQLLYSAQSDEERAEYVERIKKNNDVLLELINDILDISKLESGSLKLFYSNLSVNGLIDEVFNTFVYKKKEGVDIRLALLEEDIIVNSDKLRLIQIVTNFANNAQKFTHSGYVEIGASMVGSQHFEIYVKDTGIGIPPERQKSIFERFTQVDDFAQGTGLGLPIAKQLSELLGGYIGVESAVGKGSRFYAVFPCCKS